MAATTHGNPSYTVMQGYFRAICEHSIYKSSTSPTYLNHQYWCKVCMLHIITKVVGSLVTEQSIIYPCFVTGLKIQCHNIDFNQITKVLIGRVEKEKCMHGWYLYTLPFTFTNYRT